jgi:Uma2 family endonuclease
VVRLTQLLTAACPAQLEVLVAPFDVALDQRTLVQPDLLVVPWSDVDDRDVTEPPLLVVEVLSASTRRVDLTLKRSKYESAGCPAYWVVDLDGPSVIVWELEDGKYVERAHVVGDETLTVSAPFDVRLAPAWLVGSPR